MGKRWICSLKNKLHLNKSSAERNKIYKGLGESCKIHPFLSTLKNLHLGEPRPAESCESHGQPSRNSFRLLESGGYAPLEKPACFYHMDNELCNEAPFLFSLIKPNPWFSCSTCALWHSILSHYPCFSYCSLPFSNLLSCHITHMYADLNPF